MNRFERELDKAERFQSEHKLLGVVAVTLLNWGMMFGLVVAVVATIGYIFTDPAGAIRPYMSMGMTCGICVLFTCFVAHCLRAIVIDSYLARLKYAQDTKRPGQRR